MMIVASSSQGMGAQNRLRNCLQRVGLFLHDRIGAELLQPRLRFGSGQATAVVVGFGWSQILSGHTAGS